MDTTDHERRIAAAAEAVAARGENPTLSAVRTELGGGSYSTISPVLRAWKAAQARDDEPVREPLPDRIREAAIAGAGEIWRAALELGSERLAAERAALDATRAELDEALAEATATADELAAQLEQAQSEAQAAADAHARTETELRQALQAEQARVKTAEKTQAIAEALAEERQGEVERAQALHRELLVRLKPTPPEEAE